MTVQEAIEAIRIEGIEIKGNLRRFNEFLEGLAMAEEALEKQIPKKPILEECHKPFKCDNWKCPNCEMEFPWDIEAELKAKEYHNCPYCGQTIIGGDWGE